MVQQAVMVQPKKKHEFSGDWIMGLGHDVYFFFVSLNFLTVLLSLFLPLLLSLTLFLPSFIPTIPLFPSLPSLNLYPLLPSSPPPPKLILK